MRGWRLSWSAFDGNLIILPFDNLYNASWVSQLLCGVMNLSKSSLLMAGVDPKNLKVEGEETNAKWLKKIQRIFEESSKKIEPSNKNNFLGISFVPVKDDVDSTEKPSSYVVRIIACPFLSKHVYYVSDYEKGFHKTYKVYSLKNIESESIEPLHVKDLSIYKMIHRKFQFKRPNRPIHNH